ncbi:MAG: hypothetical protein PVJ61_03890 [Dehalococcoidia bacterium]|jgi:hypothetical protein
MNLENEGDHIKSAREIAMEKVAAMGEVTEAERLSWKYLPEGEKLAAAYMTKNANLSTALGKYDAKAATYVKKGASEILLRNIDLPATEAARQKNGKAMEGLKAIKQDKAAVENVFGKIQNIFNHYAEQGEPQRRQAYEQLKAEFGARVREAVKKQMGTDAQLNIDIENQPQFQEEWRQVRLQFDAQYLTLLNEYKQELAAID